MSAHDSNALVVAKISLIKMNSVPAQQWHLLVILTLSRATRAKRIFDSHGYGY